MVNPQAYHAPSIQQQPAPLPDQYWTQHVQHPPHLPAMTSLFRGGYPLVEMQRTLALPHEEVLHRNMLNVVDYGYLAEQERTRQGRRGTIDALRQRQLNREQRHRNQQVRVDAETQRREHATFQRDMERLQWTQVQRDGQQLQLMQMQRDREQFERAQRQQNQGELWRMHDAAQRQRALEAAHVEREAEQLQRAFQTEQWAQREREEQEARYFQAVRNAENVARCYQQAENMVSVRTSQIAMLLIKL